MWCGIISLFPEIFQAMHIGITGKAIKNQLLSLNCWNPRDFTSDKHKTVDDKPYGGGPGMVMMYEPIHLAVQAAKKAAPSPPLVIYLSPQGTLFDQPKAAWLASQKSVIFLAGRYEGIDERLITHEIDAEWSIGDYVLSGGELAAMVMLDAAIRLLPGALGDQESAALDSLSNHLLKYPQYTRPEAINGALVPPILLSGHHERIRRWRLKASLGKTWLKRPDLLAKKSLTKEETSLLNEFILEFQQKEAK